MKRNEEIRFDKLYKRHLRALKLQGLSDKTIDVYARAVRRVAQYYDCCPDRLTTRAYAAELRTRLPHNDQAQLRTSRVAGWPSAAPPC